MALIRSLSLMPVAIFVMLSMALHAKALDYDTRYYNQTLDHLHAGSHENYAKWSHRYLINDDFWGEDGGLSSSCAGPIMLYTGNEGPVDAFWEGNGFMQGLAAKWGGLIVFPEERYYGESIPSSDMRYMSTQQVLEDYVEFIDYIKKEYNAQDCPVVAFGGSYGGTLTTFLRAAYPSAVVGGLASSAPIGYYDPEGWEAHGVDEYTFSSIIARSYRDADEDCLSLIYEATDEIEGADIDTLVTTFNVCDKSALAPAASSLFLYGLEGLPQLNYPYQISDMPGWPVKAVCGMLKDGKESGDLLNAAASVTAMALSYSLAGECLKAFDEGPGNVPGDGPGAGPWGWQSCTETLHQFSSHGREAGGIRKYDFDFQTSAVDVCDDYWGAEYGVTPNPNAFAMRYGGYKLGDGKVDVSNIIWSTGGLDPWGGGGFNEKYAPSDAEARGNYYFTIPLGAHHFDLRGNHDGDPSDVREVRAKEEDIIKGWIDDHIAANHG